jgi:manganese/zinc/iron transport system ATP- binding protein
MFLPYTRCVECGVTDGLAVEARDLVVRYPGTRRSALKGITLRVPTGARVALVGHNGAGKSTLLKAAAGLLTPESGVLRVYGAPVGACLHRVAYLAQRGEIDWRFPVTLRRLVMSGRYVHLGWFARPGEADHAIVDRVIRQLGLWELRDRQIGQLSGGQQQRALLARALAQQADLLLLDEPLNAVDVETRTIVEEVLHDLHAQRKTVLIATHDLGRLEADFDAAVYLSDGTEVAPPPGGFVGESVGLFA